MLYPARLQKPAPHKKPKVNFWSVRLHPAADHSLLQTSTVGSFKKSVDSLTIYTAYHPAYRIWNHLCAGAQNAHETLIFMVSVELTRPDHCHAMTTAGWSDPRFGSPPPPSSSIRCADSFPSRVKIQTNVSATGFTHGSIAGLISNSLA